MSHTFIFSVLLLICLSCQSSDPKATEMATDICTCFKPLVDINDEIQLLLKNGKGPAAESLLPNIDIHKKEGQKCAIALMDQYVANKTFDSEQLKATMKTQCPKILDAVEDSLF